MLHSKLSASIAVKSHVVKGKAVTACCRYGKNANTSSQSISVNVGTSQIWLYQHWVADVISCSQPILVIESREPRSTRIVREGRRHCSYTCKYLPAKSKTDIISQSSISVISPLFCFAINLFFGTRILFPTYFLYFHISCARHSQETVDTGMHIAHTPSYRDVLGPHCICIYYLNFVQECVIDR